MGSGGVVVRISQKVLHAFTKSVAFNGSLVKVGAFASFLSVTIPLRMICTSVPDKEKRRKCFSASISVMKRVVGAGHSLCRVLGCIFKLLTRLICSSST